MIKVTLIALGKLKERYLADAVAEYTKRISRYADLSIKEIEPVKLAANPSDADIKAALKKEAELIFSSVPKRSFLISLCIEGKKLSSEQLSALIDEKSADGNVTFIIGSSYGLDKSVKDSSNLMLSMSDMTFPHQLARVMLLEQIYRAFKITEGSAYHK